MSVNLSLFAGAGWQFFDNNGVPLAGGLIYTYAAGTTTPQATYTSSTGGTAQANPIVLNSAGRVAVGEVWVSEGLNYKFVLKDSTFNTIGTYDNINGTYVAGDLANTTDSTLGDALVGFRQSNSSGNLTSAVGRTVHQKLQESISVLDFIPTTEVAAIQNGTSTYDCLAAFTAAMNSFSTALDDTYYSEAGTIFVPPGIYYLSGTFVIDRNLKLIGAGAPYGNTNGPSQLTFADNCDGIKIADYRASPNNKMGSGIVIQDLTLYPKIGAGTTGSGITLKTNARIVRVSVFSFPENGITIDASQNYTPASNANLWRLDSCSTSLNKGHGLFVDGADANAGAAYNHNSINNTGWGIYDSSFLGNTYVACHTSGNTAGSYKADSINARNVFIGCYSEGGQLGSVVSPSLVLGGSIDPGTDALFIYGTNSVGTAIKGDAATGVMRIGYGQPAATGNGLSFTDTTGGVFLWTFGKATGRWGWQWANLDVPDYFMFYDQNATTANGYARTLYTAGAPSSTYGATGIGSYYFGTKTQMKWRGLGTAAPTTGDYLQGDIIYHSSPTAGGYIGWVCTTAGTPGTWKTFGAISA